MSNIDKPGIICEITVAPDPKRSNLFYRAPIGLIYDINTDTSVAKAALASGGNHTDLHQYLFDYRSRVHGGNPELDYYEALIHTAWTDDGDMEYVYGLSGIYWENCNMNQKAIEVARRATQALVLLNLNFDHLPEGDSVRVFSEGELDAAPDEHIIYELDDVEKIWA